MARKEKSFAWRGLSIRESPSRAALGAERAVLGVDFNTLKVVSALKTQAALREKRGNFAHLRHTIQQWEKSKV